MKADRDVSQDDLRDMQGLIRTGFGTLPFAEYVLLDVIALEPALRWLGRVRDHIPSVLSIGRNALTEEGRVAEKHLEAWAVAFTYRGLLRLGVREDSDAPFPSPFKMGQAALLRRKLLRDNIDEDWKWGDQGATAASAQDRLLNAVSILVVRLHTDPGTQSHPDLTDESLENGGLRVVDRFWGCAASFRAENGKIVMHEPFGFRDAISQPVPSGLAVPDDAPSDAFARDRYMPPGEFVLGHRNLYGEISHCPEVIARGLPRTFGRNGAYLAVRQIHQFVDQFRSFERTHSLRAGAGATVVEKMVGRHKDGSPLQTCPAAAPSDDAFRFLVNDSQGFDCPMGAHIRRGDPRDTFSATAPDGMLSSRLHSMLRRGRPYATHTCSPACASVQAAGDGQQQCASGLLFMALVADIVRQFEFVQRQWIANTDFGALHDSVDPIAGGVGNGQMTFPAQPVGQRITLIPRFTRTLGGGYFFLPALSTLAALAAGEFLVDNEDAKQMRSAPERNGTLSQETPRPCS